MIFYIYLLLSVSPSSVLLFLLFFKCLFSIKVFKENCEFHVGIYTYYGMVYNWYILVFLNYFVIDFALL